MVHEAAPSDGQRTTHSVLHIEVDFHKTLIRRAASAARPQNQRRAQTNFDLAMKLPKGHALPQQGHSACHPSPNLERWFQGPDPPLGCKTEMGQNPLTQSFIQSFMGFA